MVKRLIHSFVHSFAGQSSRVGLRYLFGLLWCSVMMMGRLCKWWSFIVVCLMQQQQQSHKETKDDDDTLTLYYYTTIIVC